MTALILCWLGVITWKPANELRNPLPPLCKRKCILCTVMAASGRRISVLQGYDVDDKTRCRVLYNDFAAMVTSLAASLREFRCPIAKRSVAFWPLAPLWKIAADGKPYLEGLKCAACNEVLAVGSRRACPKCMAVGTLQPIKLLAERGRLFTRTPWFIAAFPGIVTPFHRGARSELEGGGTIKGNLVGLDLDAIHFDMRLQVRFETLIAPGEPAAQH